MPEIFVDVAKKSGILLVHLWQRWLPVRNSNYPKFWCHINEKVSGYWVKSPTMAATVCVVFLAITMSASLHIHCEENRHPMPKYSPDLEQVQQELRLGQPITITDNILSAGLPLLQYSWPKLSKITPHLVQMNSRQILTTSLHQAMKRLLIPEIENKSVTYWRLTVCWFQAIQFYFYVVCVSPSQPFFLFLRDFKGDEKPAHGDHGKPWILSSQPFQLLCIHHKEPGTWLRVHRVVASFF